MARKTHQVFVWTIVLVQLSLLESGRASQEYEMGRQSRIKLNLGLHVPPIVLKMPRLELPQLTIGANLIKRPDAKPLTIQLPPLPQVSFGDSGGGGYNGGTATYSGGGGGGEGYEGDQYSSGTQTHQKTVKLEKKIETPSNKPEENAVNDMRVYGSVPVPYGYGSAPFGAPGTTSFMAPHPMSYAPAGAIPYPQPTSGANVHPLGPYSFVPSPMIAPPKEVSMNSASEQTPYLFPTSNMPTQESMQPVSMRANQPQPHVQQQMQGQMQSSNAFAGAPQPHLMEHPPMMSFGPNVQYDAPVQQMERPLVARKYMSTAAHKPKVKPDMSAYSMAPSPQANYHPQVAMPVESNTAIAPEESGRVGPPNEMYHMYPSPTNFHDQTPNQSPMAEDDFAKAYNAAPRVPFRRLQAQGRLVGDSQRQAN